MKLSVRLILYAFTISIWQESGCSRCFVPLSFSTTTDSDESQFAEEVSQQANLVMGKIPATVTRLAEIRASRKTKDVAK